MRVPAIHGVIQRRILVTYRMDPTIARTLLPGPFEPQIVRGHAVAGICLIQLVRVRPRFWPAAWGLASQNAAHRMAVTWRDGERNFEGVYIPRRDTSSRATVLLGGRLFAGVHHHARFRTREFAEGFQISVASDDGKVAVQVDAHPSGEWQSELFNSADAASNFYRNGARGYSPAHAPNQAEGLELVCEHWQATPLAVTAIRSSFFEDEAVFPPGSAEFDCALEMRNIPHRWEGLARLRTSDRCQQVAAVCC
jgi:Uncharacterized conserved protein (COG2071)